MLEFTTREYKRLIILAVKGRCDMEAVRKFKEILDEQLKKNPGVIAFDCSALEFIDSTAIGAIVKFFKETEKRKIKLVFYELNPGLKNMFSIAQFNKFFDITTKKNFIEEYLKNARNA